MGSISSHQTNKNLKKIVLEVHFAQAALGLLLNFRYESPHKIGNFISFIFLFANHFIQHLVVFFFLVDLLFFVICLVQNACSVWFSYFLFFCTSIYCVCCCIRCPEPTLELRRAHSREWRIFPYLGLETGSSTLWSGKFIWIRFLCQCCSCMWNFF